MAKTALDDLAAGDLDGVRLFLREGQASGVSAREARREVRREAERLQRLRQSVALLLEALNHEAAFGRFANRDYAMARAMEDGDPIDGDLEEKWDEVVLAKAKRDRDKKRQESAQKGPSRPSSSAPSSKPEPARANHNARRSSSSNRQRYGGKGGKSGGPQPCFECGRTDHWLKDCPEAKKKKKD